jgi:RHS repeat-associated protein
MTSRDASGNTWYLYTADDERIGARTGGGDWVWIRGFDNKVLSTYRTSEGNLEGLWEWQESHHYRDGTLDSGVTLQELLRYPRTPTQPPTGRFFHVDHLGTPRLITNHDGQKIALHDYQPFGKESTALTQEQTDWLAARPEPMKFTGHERDFTTTASAEVHDYLDYMHARHYSPTVGRFLSVDPTWSSADLAKPQTWNRYSYVLNNPINNTDPDGKCGIPGACPEPPSEETDAMIARQLLPELPSAKSPLVLDPLNRPLETLANVLMIATLVSPFAGDEPVGKAAVTTVQTLAENGTKADVLAMLRGGAGSMTQAQRAAVIRHVKSGTTKEAISVVRNNADGIVYVSRTRPGADGSQTFISEVGRAGNTRIVQTANNAAGQQTHYDPKGGTSFWGAIRDWFTR